MAIVKKVLPIPQSRWGQLTFLVCTLCGAMVWDIDAHYEFHDGLEWNVPRIAE